MGLILGAIYFYPDEYNFFTNFISDLGRTVTPNGNNNTISSSIYLVAMVVLGLVSIGFWFFTQNVIYHAFRTKWKYIVLIGSFSGIISSIAIGLTGFFPLDTQQATHNVLGAIYFGLSGISISLYSIFFIILFFANKDFERFVLYSLLSVIVPVIFAFIIIGILSEISTLYIVFLVSLFLTLAVLFQFAFQSLFSYLSYLISFSMLVLEAILLLLILSLLIIYPVMEVSFVLGMVAFMMINNIRIFQIDIQS